MTPHAVEFEELVLYTACPLCDGRELSHIVSAECTEHPSYRPGLSLELHWQMCDRCGHVFRNGYYTEAAAQLIFAEVHAEMEIGHEIDRWRMVSARMIERVLPYRQRGTWLDVGFGNGGLLFTAAEFGFRAIGCDLRAASVDKIREFGIEAYCADVSDLIFDHEVSVVSMGDVLEHIPYPKGALQTVNGLLEPGGVLLLSMPNFGTAVWQFMDMHSANPYWSEVEHYHNFSRVRLYELLAETGFEVLSYGISERYRSSMEVVARKA